MEGAVGTHLATQALAEGMEQDSRASHVGNQTEMGLTTLTPSSRATRSILREAGQKSTVRCGFFPGRAKILPLLALVSGESGFAK